MLHIGVVYTDFITVDAPSPGDILRVSFKRRVYMLTRMLLSISQKRIPYSQQQCGENGPRWRFVAPEA